MFECIFGFVLIAILAAPSEACIGTPTTVSGTKAIVPQCSGDLIFKEDFDSLDESTWDYIVTLSGGRNSEFQWYTNDRNTSFALDGNLHISPRLTSDYFGEEFLTEGHVVIPKNECTNSAFSGCEKQGTPDEIINPIRTARIRTLKSFSFKFGVLEVRAKMPAGDWLWPAIWLMPKSNVYGNWPMSGEIDLVETRANRKLFSGGTNIGAEQVGSTLHFGPMVNMSAWRTSHFLKNLESGFNNDFHIYKLTWTEDSISFAIDDKTFGIVEVGGGFWERGNFAESGVPNPWVDATIMAPFDEEFHLIINMAVGSTSFFSDYAENEGYAKPWSNKSPYPARDFWNAKADWLPTWNYNINDDADLQVDYIRAYAL